MYDGTQLTNKLIDINNEYVDKKDLRRRLKALHPDALRAVLGKLYSNNEIVEILLKHNSRDVNSAISIVLNPVP